MLMHLLETAAHEPSATPFIAGGVAFVILFGALGALRLFGSSRPHS